MPLNISNAEDAYLTGYARWSKFLDQFQESWYAPIRKMLVAAMLDSMDAETYTMVRAMNPEAFDEVVKMTEV